MLETNALDSIITSIYSQKQTNREQYPITYYLKTIVDTKLNYLIYNKEILAIISSFQYQQVQLEGVTGLTRSHVPARFNVLNPCLRSSRNTYARSPATPIYTRTQYTKILLYPNVFVLNTHSYAYVAFFNYYPVQYIVFWFVPTSVTVIRYSSSI